MSGISGEQRLDGTTTLAAGTWRHVGIVLGAGGWWISASTGGYSGAARGKQFVLGGAIGALVIGLAPTIVNLLFAAGRGG